MNAGSSWVGPLLSKLSTGGEARKCNVLAYHRLWIQRAVVFLALLFLFSPDASRGELQTYFTTDSSSAQQEPPPGGGNGWTAIPDTGFPITVNSSGNIWLACGNNFKPNMIKSWSVYVNGISGQVSPANLQLFDDVGFGLAGTRVQLLQHGHFYGADINEVQYYQDFQPQPYWERIGLHNRTSSSLSFWVATVSSCVAPMINSNTFGVPTCTFGATGAGVMLSNQFITQIEIFPQTVPINSGVPPTFNAPTNSGQWTGTPVYVDPFGSNAPLGGFSFVTTGPGLDPSNSCSFSFTMQGPAADMQYKMYAYDSVMTEFQEFEIDLRSSMSINPINNQVALQFNSVLGLNYTLQLSPDLSNWNPIQTFTGTGGTNNDLEPIFLPFGFFRLQSVPSTPPLLSAINAVQLSNSLTLIFNEALNSATATNPASYNLNSGSGPDPVQGVSQIRPDAVTLQLLTPLLPGSSYLLGVGGVADLAGQPIVPLTFPFTPVNPQTPCPGGTLLVRQTYSECNPDGYWHVVEDDYYSCPPGGTTQKIRVADNKTTQPCGSPLTAPNPVGLLYANSGDVAANCQNPVLLGQVTVAKCVSGLWWDFTYLLYQCANGATYLSGPVQAVPANPPTTCGAPPPPPPGG